MSITAKVTLSTKTVSVGSVGLNFAADYQDGRNKEWAAYTPTLNLSMTVIPKVAEKFNVGAHYTLTFTEEES